MINFARIVTENYGVKFFPIDSLKFTVHRFVYKVNYQILSDKIVFVRKILPDPYVRNFLAIRRVFQQNIASIMNGWRFCRYFENIIGNKIWEFYSAYKR